MTELVANPEPLEPVTPAAALSEADFRGCRFIEGEAIPIRDGMFCGAPTPPGSPWCATHRAIVWSASRRRSLALRKSPKPSKPLK
jgi:hypothetical protein